MKTSSMRSSAAAVVAALALVILGCGLAPDGEPEARPSATPTGEPTTCAGDLIGVDHIVPAPNQFLGSLELYRDGAEDVEDDTVCAIVRADSGAWAQDVTSVELRVTRCAATHRPTPCELDDPTIAAPTQGRVEAGNVAGPLSLPARGHCVSAEATVTLIGGRTVSVALPEGELGDGPRARAYCPGR